MRERKLLRYLWQLPVIILWRFAIFCASKSYHRGFVICDITSTQSKYQEHFKADVRSVLDELGVKSEEALERLQQHVRVISRAEIPNRFEYYSRPRLLLLRLDYALRPGLRLSIERNFLEFLSLADQGSED